MSAKLQLRLRHPNAGEADLQRHPRFQAGALELVTRKPGKHQSRQAHPPKPGCVLFVGGSTLKRWLAIAKYFPEVPALNRGFGGARMSDVLAYAGWIVLPCKPSHILVVAGDDVLAAKDTRHRTSCGTSKPSSLKSTPPNPKF